MIDTDKYEGHTPAPWDGILSGYFTIEQLKEIDKTLMQDAPLLLEEVKRLRERLDLAERYIIEPTLTRNYFADVVSKGLDDEMDNLG